MGAVAVLAPYGSQTPLQAQEADEPGTGVGIRLSGMVSRITYTIVHQFTVEVDSLTASEAYEVIVSSDTAALGIDSCGTTSQTQLVTGTASHAFKVIVYACAVGGGTVTAEVRRSGSSSAEASASQGLTVLPTPDYVPADERPARGARGVRGATRNVARAGTPGIVQNLQVPTRGPTSFKITWTPPANGGGPLTGYGLLIWHKDATQPPYNQAASIGVTDNHTFTGCSPAIPTNSVFTRVTAPTVAGGGRLSSRPPRRRPRRLLARPRRRIRSSPTRSARTPSGCAGVRMRRLEAPHSRVSASWCGRAGRVGTRAGRGMSARIRHIATA